MRGVMLVLRRCLAVAALLAALGPVKTASGQHASGQPVQRPSDVAGITVEGMLEEGGQVRRQYSCPARFIRMGNSCYFLSKTMASWHDAHFRCRAKGAQLAVFEKRSENAHMRKHLMREEMAPLARWIGGIYQQEKRFWMWGSSGLPVAYKAFPRRMVTRDWAWHCIAMDPTAAFHWRPASCLHVKHYICETPLRRTRTRTQDAGTKQHKGPRRKEGDVLVDKVSRGGAERLPAAPTNLHADGSSAATPAGPAGPAGPRRLNDRRPTAVNRSRVGGAVHRYNHANRPRAPGPPPAPRQPGGPRYRRPRPRPQRPVDLADIYPALRKGAAAAARGAPRRPQQTHGLGDGDKRPPPASRRLPEMVDATVHTLYPPPGAAQRDSNDFSNDV